MLEDICRFQSLVANVELFSELAARTVARVSRRRRRKAKDHASSSASGFPSTTYVIQKIVKNSGTKIGWEVLGDGSRLDARWAEQ